MSKYSNEFKIKVVNAYLLGEGGDPHGKFIILSFREDEEALFSKAISAFASVAEFSTVAISTDAPLLFGSLLIDLQRRLVWQAGQTASLPPMEVDICIC